MSATRPKFFCSTSRPTAVIKMGSHSGSIPKVSKCSRRLSSVLMCSRSGSKLWSRASISVWVTGLVKIGLWGPSLACIVCSTLALSSGRFSARLRSPMPLVIPAMGSFSNRSRWPLGTKTWPGGLPFCAKALAQITSWLSVSSAA